jgi:tetratricopeptide (TPR) repeat protein
LKIYIQIILAILLGILLLACSTGSDNKNYLTLLLEEVRSNPNLSDSSQNSDRAKTHVINASVFEQQYKFANAIIEYQLALRFDSSAAIYYSLAKNYRELNYPDIALENAIIAIRKDSTFIPALQILGELYVQNLRIDEAISTYYRLYEMEPSSKNKVNLARLF